jgi:hypothetical protein
MLETLDINKENYEWAIEDIVLYEAKNELIVLQRNILLGQEWVIMTNSLIAESERDPSLWCEMVDYHYMLPYRFKIQKYQDSLDECRLFIAFFNMGVDEFFSTISY